MAKKTDELDISEMGRRLGIIRRNNLGKISDREFGTKAGLSHTWVASIEGRKTQKKKTLKVKKRSTFGIDQLDKYLRACRVPIGEFWADFSPAGAEDPEHKAVHVRVQDILSAGPDATRRLVERLEDVEGWLGSQIRSPTSRPESREGGGRRKASKQRDSQPV